MGNLKTKSLFRSPPSVDTLPDSAAFQFSYFSPACKRMGLPKPSDAKLAYFVREAFPSRATGTALVQGILRKGEHLDLISEMNQGGVAFGDGIEADSIRIGWGQRVILATAEERLQLVGE